MQPRHLDSARDHIRTSLALDPFFPPTNDASFSGIDVSQWWDQSRQEDIPWGAYITVLANSINFNTRLAPPTSQPVHVVRDHPVSPASLLIQIIERGYPVSEALPPLAVNLLSGDWTDTPSDVIKLTHMLRHAPGIDAAINALLTGLSCPLLISPEYIDWGIRIISVSPEHWFTAYERIHLPLAARGPMTLSMVMHRISREHFDALGAAQWATMLSCMPELLPRASLYPPDATLWSSHDRATVLSNPAATRAIRSAILATITQE